MKHCHYGFSFETVEFVTTKVNNNILYKSGRVVKWKINLTYYIC